jgi:hypothetical protein
MPDNKDEQKSDDTGEKLVEEILKEEQPKKKDDDKKTAGDAEGTPKPKEGVAAIAEVIEKEAKPTTPTAGIGESGTTPPPEKKEGEGLFFPDAQKIKQRATKIASKDIKEASKTEPQQPVAPDTTKPSKAEAEPEATEEVAEEEPPIQRPPPPSGPSKGTSPPPQSHKQPKKTGIGQTTQVAGYITNSPLGKDGKPRYALVIDNLTKKDVDYIAFMCAYLADPERKYIPFAHPSYLAKFSLNFLLMAIKEEIADNES